MSISVRSVSSDSASSDTDVSLTPSTPAGLIAGDILVAFGFCLQSRSITPPTGFTQRATDASTDYRGFLWTKTAVGGDDLTFTVSGTFGSPSVAILAISGGTETGIAATIAHIDSSDNAPLCPPVTTIAANSLVLSLEGYGNGMTASCSGQTEVLDITGGSFGTHIGIYSEIQSSAGASGGRTVATSGFAKWVAASLALQPGGSPLIAYPSASAEVESPSTWTNLSNAYAADFVYASSSVSFGQTNTLRLTGFGFILPPLVAIVGIKLETKFKSIGTGEDGSGTGQDYVISLVRGGSEVGNNLQTIGPGGYTPESPVSVTYGGSSNLWGTTWTKAQIEDSSFGVDLKYADFFTGNLTAGLDYARITVYYIDLSLANSSSAMLLAF